MRCHYTAGGVYAQNRPSVCGIDVHKTFVVATIAATERNVTAYKTKRFSTFTKDLRSLANGFHQMSASRSAWSLPASTGSQCTISLNLPARSPWHTPSMSKQSAARRPTKRIPSGLQTFTSTACVRQLYPPSGYPRNSRFAALPFQTGFLQSSEKNRVQNSLTVSNIMLSSVVSDTFGKSASAILAHLLKHPDDQEFDFRPLLHGSMLKNEMILPLPLTARSRRSRQKRSDCATTLIILQRYFPRLKKRPCAWRTLIPRHTIIASDPGIRDLSALALFSEIGADMSAFPSAKHLCSWAGLAPSNDQSAGKKKSVRISRAGVYIKPLLVQCANAAIKDKTFPHFRVRYEKIKRRRGHKRAIIAIARMLLTAIYHCLKNGEMFDPSRFVNDDSPVARDAAVSRLFNDAKRSGYSLVYSSA